MLDISSQNNSFIVLNVDGHGKPVAAGLIESLRYSVPGIDKLLVDAERGKIHVLYNGSLTTLNQILQFARCLGYDVYLPEHLKRLYRIPDDFGLMEPSRGAA